MESNFDFDQVQDHPAGESAWPCFASISVLGELLGLGNAGRPDADFECSAPEVAAHDINSTTERELSEIDAAAGGLGLAHPNDARIVHHADKGSPEVMLRGVECYAFSVEIDTISGALRRAATMADALDLAVEVPGLPADKAPHVAVTREVTIEPRH